MCYVKEEDVVKTLRKKDDIGFTTMMKPPNSFTCNQARKGTRRPMRLLYKNCHDQLLIYY